MPQSIKRNSACNKKIRICTSRLLQKFERKKIFWLGFDNQISRLSKIGLNFLKAGYKGDYNWN